MPISRVGKPIRKLEIGFDREIILIDRISENVELTHFRKRSESWVRKTGFSSDCFA